MYTIKVNNKNKTFSIKRSNRVIKVQRVGKRGIKGDTGEGVPVGGTTGQVLAKNSNTDFDTKWVDNEGGLQSIVAGTNITVDNTDPKNPIINSQGGGDVETVNGQSGVVILDADDIDDTSTTHKFATASQLSNADSAVQPGDLATVATSGDSDDISEGSTNLFLTSAERTKLSNTSGTNTGDQTLSGLGGAMDTSGLYTPRRRPRPPKVTKMIQSFDQTGHSWFSGGTAVSSNAADTDSEVGVHASIVTGTTGTSTYSKYNFGTFNATDRNLVALIRVEDMTAIAGTILRIGSGSNVTGDYYDLQVSAGNVSSSLLNAGEWVPVTFSWAKSIAVGNPDRSSLKSLQFRVPAYNNKSTTVRFKSIGISEQRGPYCLISFDDNQVSANLALPYMNKYGFAGTMYSIAERIGTPNYQTMENVISMQNDFGWEIACHSYSIAAHDSTNGMQDLTLSALDTELRNLKKWALQNNISGADHFAWPKGRFTPEMIEVAERYFVSAGMVSHYINQALPTFTPMRMARRGITAGTTLQNIKDEIDAAIANNTSIELLFHKIVPTGATGDTEYNASDFSAVIDYIASSGIPVRTISEVVYGYCDADGTKLDGIESNADVTDATNVAAAGAVMTTGTNNMTGVYNVTNAGTANALKIDQNGNTSASTSAGGALLVENTGNTGAGIVAYSAQASSSGHLVSSRVNNATFAHSALYLDYNGTGSGLNVVNTGTGTSNTAVGINSTNESASAVNIVGKEASRGTIKVRHDGKSDGSDSGASALSLELATSGTAAQGIFIDAPSGTTGKLLNIRNSSSDRFVVDASGNVILAGTVDGRDIATDGSKLDGIESGADVTDATNVAAAGAVMEADTSTADMDFVLDEDDMASNSATKIPTQQSTKAYVDNSPRQKLVTRESGSWYGAVGNSAASTGHNVSAAQVLMTMPVWLAAGTYDRIAVTTTVAAVSTWRLGVYNCDQTTGDPRGQSLVIDCGTVDMNATPGLLAITTSITIPTTGLYGLTVLCDAFTANPTVYRHDNSSTNLQVIPNVSVNTVETAGRSARFTVRHIGVPTGSLPATHPTGGSWTDAGPRILVRKT